LPFIEWYAPCPVWLVEIIERGCFHIYPDAALF
jgi:hypothetical protein